MDSLYRRFRRDLFAIRGIAGNIVGASTTTGQIPRVTGTPAPGSAPSLQLTLSNDGTTAVTYTLMVNDYAGTTQTVTVGANGSTNVTWPVDSNGRRIGTAPIASIPITDGSEGGGAWGPVAAKAGQRYELALVSPVKTIHVYPEPFVRSDYAIRLLGSVPISTLAGKFPGRTGAVQIRYEEYWGDEPGQNDELLVNGLNLCTPSLCPWKKQVNAYFAFDWEGKEESTLNEEPVLSALPFIQAAQVYIRGATPPDETVSYQLRSRLGGGLRTLNAPNWEGTTNQVELFWNDFEKITF